MEAQVIADFVRRLRKKNAADFKRYVQAAIKAESVVSFSREADDVYRTLREAAVALHEALADCDADVLNYIYDNAKRYNRVYQNSSAGQSGLAVHHTSTEAA